MEIIHGQSEKSDLISCSFPKPSTHHDDIEYSTVPITDTQLDLDTNYRVLSFHLKDDHIKVNLEPSNGVLVHKDTPVWMVKNVNNNIQFRREENALKDIESYIDESTHSSFVKLPEPNGYYFYYGVYDYNVGVKAAPRERARRRREVKGNKTISTIDHHVYVIDKSKNDNPETAYSSIVPVLLNATSNLSPPNTVYPEILVIMEHALYSHYKGNLQEALSYIITFWNAVDLKFRALREPAVRLNIAGIIIEEEEAAFLNNSKIYQDGKFKGKVSRNIVLDDIGINLYASSLEVGKDYDLAVYMMGSDLTSSPDEEKRHGLDGILGVAKVASSCRKNDTEKIVNGVAAFEDSNGYIGILHGAHELAHLFGAFHDGAHGLSQLGLPGAEHCLTTESDDYIMSTKRIDGKHFSYCSKETMRIFFHKESAECLRNPPVMSSEYISSIILPGKKLSLDEQCTSAGFLRAHFNDTSVCDHLYCVAKASDDGIDYITSLPGADGSICDKGYHCIDGRCVQNSNTNEYFQYNYSDRRNHIGK
ncbi:venom metalloproteinase 3-like isoform X2 [Leptopilina heterotoma]|uniref:venom metalloproteinase 3-like isoform X2 n=1 Tax=Leptopilina heterotoma TaxID=63436 RepID=UPI001CA8B5BF|nr:venom metalloproteinase 3-like isoform X2 [Leptopilina heterotoma]